MSAAPGWYPDGRTSTSQRWWDGQAWSDHVWDPTIVTVASPYPSGDVRVAAAAPRKRMALWKQWVLIVLSLSGLLCAMKVVTVLGHKVTTRSVTYQVTGASSDGYYVIGRDLKMDRGHFMIPLSPDLTFDIHVGGVLYLSVTRESEASGSVTCRILVDGVVVSEDTDSGRYASPTCSATA